ncbi:hypothetical protein GWK47_024917 [Chionoecetes opilio]|uniref:Uncharacterized protein n=1 Tax=Chionoecetes opilio TaxID=41210 RepID=A0A8J4XV20_CHIOP|nr:hypothetical protein GWK47_024917 [Chionoecetes opilio]
MWSFVGHINHMIEDTEEDLERLDRGLIISRGEYNHMQFISAVAYTMDTHLLLLETTPTRDGKDSDDADEAAIDQENQASQQQNHRHACSVSPLPGSRWPGVLRLAYRCPSQESFEQCDHCLFRSTWVAVLLPGQRLLQGRCRAETRRAACWFNRALVNSFEECWDKLTSESLPEGFVAHKVPHKDIFLITIKLEKIDDRQDMMLAAADLLDTAADNDEDQKDQCLAVANFTSEQLRLVTKPLKRRRYSSAFNDQGPHSETLTSMLNDLATAISCVWYCETREGNVARTLLCTVINSIAGQYEDVISMDPIGSMSADRQV